MAGLVIAWALLAMACESTAARSGMHGDAAPHSPDSAQCDAGRCSSGPAGAGSASERSDAGSAGTTTIAGRGSSGNGAQPEGGVGQAGQGTGPGDAAARLVDAAATAVGDDDAQTHNPDTGVDLDDSGVISGADGSFACRGDQPYANDCTEPLVDSQFQSDPYSWTLELLSGHLTITSIGFDQDHFGCTGSWSSGEFACVADWSRAGRVCDNTLRLRSVTNDELIFWIGDRDGERAICRR
jgi:hypothetical protein